MRSLFLIFVHFLPAAAQSDICVRNESAHAYLFVAEVRDGARAVSELPAGGELCAAGAGGGVVSVFENAHALEGCSRLVAAGGSDSLIRYADFDRCEWASHR